MNSSRRQQADILHQAVVEDDANAFSRVLDEEGAFETLLEMSKGEKSLLSTAAQAGSTRVLDAWRSFGLAPDGWVGKHGNSLLHEATRTGMEGGEETAEWLIERHGVAPHVRNSHGQTALSTAMENGNLAMTRWMARRLAADGLLDEFVAEAPAPHRPALGSAWRLGALIDSRELPGEALQWIGQGETTPAGGQRRSVWMDALSRKGIGQEMASILLEEGLKVPGGLALDAWNDRARQEDLAGSMGWAVEHGGGALVHPLDGRRLIDTLVEARNLALALRAMDEGARLAAGSLIPLVEWTLTDAMLDNAQAASLPPGGGPKQEARRRRGLDWARLWDSLPEQLDAARGLQVPERLHPFFQTPRWTGQQVGQWLKARQGGDAPGQDERARLREWLAVAREIANVPAGAERKMRL